MDCDGIYGKQQVSLVGDVAPLEVYRRKTLARLNRGGFGIYWPRTTPSLDSNSSKATGSCWHKIRLITQLIVGTFSFRPVISLVYVAACQHEPFNFRSTTRGKKLHTIFCTDAIKDTLIQMVTKIRFTTRTNKFHSLMPNVIIHKR